MAKTIKYLGLADFGSFIDPCLDFRFCPNSFEGRIELLSRRDQREF